MAVRDVHHGHPRSNLTYDNGPHPDERLLPDPETLTDDGLRPEVATPAYFH